MQGRPIAVIGGGFFGCSIAELLARRGGPVVLLEREHELLSRSSYRNQARLHGGYHYPRSFGTAYRSRLNFPRFVEEYGDAIVKDFVQLYAVARTNSQITAPQFETFCRNIGAPLWPAPERYARLFSRRLVESVYVVQEYAFNAATLRRIMTDRLARAGVEVHVGSCVVEVRHDTPDALDVLLQDGNGYVVSRLINCTYSGLSTIKGVFRTWNRLKHEITELALIRLPPELEGVSVTVVDGPFFSFVPFPDRGLATLSHVRYTPHAAWIDGAEGVAEPFVTLQEFPKETRFEFMLRDAMRYLPAIENTEYAGSIFEVKTVLVKNENDDGRSILIESDPEDSRILSVMGSKIDNVYDVLTTIGATADGE